MTCYVSSGMLNPTHSLTHVSWSAQVQSCHTDDGYINISHLYCISALGLWTWRQLLGKSEMMTGGFEPGSWQVTWMPWLLNVVDFWCFLRRWCNLDDTQVAFLITTNESLVDPDPPTLPCVYATYVTGSTAATFFNWSQPVMYGTSYYWPWKNYKLTLSPPIPLRLYTLAYWSNPTLLIFDIQTLWRSLLSARASECQKNSSSLEQLALKGLKSNI